VAIPGFFWDPEKNRYFRIQEDHHVPHGASYTVSDVEHRKKRSQKEKAEQDESRKRLPVLLPSRKRLLNSLEGSQLLCTIGSAEPVDVSSAANRKFAQDLEPRHDVQNYSPRVFFDATTFYNGTSSRQSSQRRVNFRYDQVLKVMYLSVDGEHSSYRPELWTACLDRSDPFRYHGIDQRHLDSRKGLGFSTRISGLEAWWSPKDKPARITRIPIIPGECVLWGTTENRYGLTLRYGAGVQGPGKHSDWSPLAIQSRGERESLECAPHCTCADQSPPAHEVYYAGTKIIGNFGYGTQEVTQLALLDSSQGLGPCSAISIASGRDKNMSSFQVHKDGRVQQHGSHKVTSTILAVEWLSDNTFVSGLRNGSVLIRDIRQASGLSEAIWHGGAVANLSRIDHSSHYVVANGIPDCLAMYDLRMGLPRSGEGQQTSTPVVVYEHSNSEFPSNDMGFDVLQNLGLMAAAQGDGSIKIFSLKSGKTITRLWANPKDGVDLGCASPRPVTGIQIVEEDRGSWRVLASKGPLIYDFAHSYGDEAEEC
jgi:hypothetical protein